MISRNGTTGEDLVILVDSRDREVGTKEKMVAHLGEGILHRAFSAFVFNAKSELLVQKRAGEKMLWPGYWSNTCCSHPRPAEDVKEAGERRLREELGFSCDLSILGSFQYRAAFGSVGSENELCYVAKGIYDGSVAPNAGEVAEIAWINAQELRKSVEENSDHWTPWFKIELERFGKQLGV